MFVEILDVFGRHRTVINLSLVVEINTEDDYIRTTDGKRYDIVPSTTRHLLQILKERELFCR